MDITTNRFWSAKHDLETEPLHSHGACPACHISLREDIMVASCCSARNRKIEAMYHTEVETTKQSCQPGMENTRLFKYLNMI